MSEPVQRKPNRLAKEKSPYLLQHKNNPVDWYPWGQEAFEKAKQEDKPVFLSVGYSTCHWCHVMERESFEDEETAEILNKNFISIKLDREERPDIDNIYMTFCQIYTGSGGWPLSIFMTPDKKPFFAGTYFPKESRYGMPGFISLLNSITELWKEDREKVSNTGEEIIEILSRVEKRESKEIDEEKFITNAVTMLHNTFDFKHGGFGNKPKFPSPHILMFLLRYWKTHEGSNALTMVEETLKSMYKGGICDHIGFGFSRYSTDEKWLAPHFEKMLYDNAMLAYIYCETYSATGNELYKEIAQEIFEYVLRDMTSKEGGFYSAEDADSEGVEGKFYVFTPQEIKDILGEKDGEYYCEIYDITQRGNFEGKNIPNLIETDLEQLNDEELKSSLENMRKKLFEHRDKRIHPFKDDKILTSWNGLMIAAFAYGARVFQNNKYLEEAEKAAKFILKNLVRDDGRLLGRYRDGEAANLGILQDYSYLIWGLIEIYLTGFNAKYLKKAIELNNKMIDLFWDKEHDGLFLYGSDGELLIIRPKELYDGAIPSGSSVAAHNMIMLSRITGDFQYEDRANKLLKTFTEEVEKSYTSYLYYGASLLLKLNPGAQVVICGDKSEHETEEMLKEAYKNYDPYKVVLLKDKESEKENIEEICPILKDKEKVNNKTAAYVCKNYTCKAPVTSYEELSKLL